MHKNLTIFDFDGTFCEKNSIDLLCFIKKLMLGKIAYSLWVLRFLLGVPRLLWFYSRDSERFNQILYSYYKGIDSDRLNEIIKSDLIDFFKNNSFPQALENLAKARSNGDHLLVVSGNLNMFLDPYFATFSIDKKAILANSLEIKSKKLTGEIIGKTIDNYEKAAVIKKYIAENSLHDVHVTIYGNSHWDIPMLELADAAFCVNPNTKLQEWAVTKSVPILNWQLD